MMKSQDIEFPTVGFVEGGLSHDGRHILLQLATLELGQIRFSLTVADLESFVTLLLRMAAGGRPPESVEDRIAYEPIPVSGLSAGELVDGSGCLGITVGGTELMFQIPVTALADVAHTLLMVGAQDGGRRPS